MYQMFWRDTHRPESLNEVGSCMKALVGVAYAAATSGSYLPSDTHLFWTSSAQIRQWAYLWWEFQDYGLTPRIRDRDPRLAAQRCSSACSSESSRSSSSEEPPSE